MDRGISAKVQIDEAAIDLQRSFSHDEVLDAVEASILEEPQVQCDAKYTFTKGLMCKELFMPAGIKIISKCHNTQHQWVALCGIVEVWTKENGWTFVRAPDHGITQPGTRRVLITHTYCVWMTFHPTDHYPKNNTKEAVLEAALLVEEDIILKRVNPFIGTSEVRKIE